MRLKYLCKSNAIVQTCRKLVFTSTRNVGQSTRSKLEGMAVAPLTHFDKSGDLNLSSLERCGKYFKQAKFQGMFVNGTLGEGLNMTNTERKTVAEKWKEVGDKNGLYVILHIGAGNLRDTQDLAGHARDIGVDAIAALPTTYHKPATEEQLICYLEKIAEAVPELPLLYYEYNITTGVYLNIPKMLEMAEARVPTLYGLKHTSPELTSALNCSKCCGGKYKIFFGAESLYLPSLSLGIPDVITTPIMGEYFHNIKHAFDTGDIQTAQEEQMKAQKLSTILLTHGGGIAGYKAMFKLLTGIDVGNPRLPLPTMTPAKEQALKDDLQRQGFKVQG